MVKKKESKVTHKELLTFSNLTNLEWQFGDIEPVVVRDEKGIPLKDKNGNIIKKRPKLKDLLDPESFIREETNPETGETKEKYVYMDHLTDEEIIRKGDRDKGFQKMRRAAGIGLEYLDHSYTGKDKDERMTTEGSFLNDWEVIYGADNYKVVADYLDYLYSKQPEKLKKASNSKDKFMSSTNGSGISVNLEKEEERENNKRYPTRKEVEDMKKATETIKIVTTLIKISTKVVLPTMIGVKHGDEILDLKKVLSVNNRSEVLKKLYESILKKANINGLSIGDLANIVEGQKGLESFSNKWIGKGFEKILKMKQNEIDNLTEKDLNGFKELEEYPEIHLTKSLDMKNTGFRVVALKNKKSNQIVIAYTGGTSDGNKRLPKERDLLQLVYDKICRDNRGCKIRFTGINNGADLSFISSLLCEDKATIFYTKNTSAKDYLSFDKEDLDRDYDGGFKIVKKSCKDILTEEIWGLVPYIVTSSTIWVPVITILGLEGLNILKELFEDIEISGFYNKLSNKSWGYIEKAETKSKSIDTTNGSAITVGNDENQGIKGILTDEIIKKSVQDIEIQNGTIPVKLEDAFYLESKGYSKFLIKNRDIAFMWLQGNSFFCQLDKKDQVYEITKIYKTGINLKKIETKNILNEKSEGEFIVNIMKMIYRLQRSYLEEKVDINYVYSHEKEIIKEDKKLPERIKEDKLYNEFYFLPFIDKMGNITKEIREGYIKSVYKSIINIETCYGYNYYHQIKDELEPKYKKHRYKEDNLQSYSYDLDLDKSKTLEIEEVEKKFFEILDEKLNSVTIERILSNRYNHFNLLKDKLGDTTDNLKGYYEVAKRPQFKTIGVRMTGEPSLEYRYNPEDWILGGEFQIPVDIFEQKKDVEFLSIGKILDAFKGDKK
ncbi:MAG: hypothetical protein ACQERZ_05725 [Fusobacteriota bacterium]